MIQSIIVERLKSIKLSAQNFCEDNVDLPEEKIYQNIIDIYSEGIDNLIGDIEEK